ncbi:Nickel uptake substrate-specific transmembrane region [Caulifigura coniformis]|uniref:Nickel uptake substrate-specific transmembrane region n=1 Tax=Caulifigura coniformis TaxID=2527983 RepID=A0A517SI37_9PLAN|nr:DUF4198 domain-containing protein [Caulifigura coniformis]QDT55777.1 Nickel uptake substrate-specific transmembrane region [Caulifigura coniformis]
MPRPLILAIALVLVSPLTANAHKMWLLPSDTVLSGSEPLITVDGAISNDLFYFNHHALPLDTLVITAPDGSQVEGESKAMLKYRSVFDVPLRQKGTYKIAVPRSGVFASWEADGKPQRWRGAAKDVAAKIPANAEKVEVSETVGRIETFVTNGAPSDRALQTTGKGIELIPLTHPNDLYVGSKGRFRLLVDGKPTGELKIEMVRGGTRYRDSQDEIHATTDTNGEFEVEFKEPGMYWMETSTSDAKTTVSQAKTRYLSYTATFEVLPK